MQGDGSIVEGDGMSIVIRRRHNRFLPKLQGRFKIRARKSRKGLDLCQEARIQT